MCVWHSTVLPCCLHHSHASCFQRLGPTAGENQEPLEIGDHTRPGEIPHSMAHGYSSHDNGQHSVNALGCEIDTSRGDLDLVESLVHKLQNRPQCFHLEWPPSVSPPDHVMYWIVDRATGCPWETRLNGTRPLAIDDIRLTECRCDLSGGNEPRDRWHVAYQEGCLKLVKANISLFEELSQSGVEGRKAVVQLRRIFENLMQSALLQHCRLDTELLSLCRSFFELAKGSLNMRVRSDRGEEGRQNMLKWFEVGILYWVQFPPILVFSQN